MRPALRRASELPGGADDPVVWDHLGDVQFRTGDRDKARQAWRNLDARVRHLEEAAAEGKLSVGKLDEQQKRALAQVEI